MLFLVPLACSDPLDEAWDREAEWASLDGLEAARDLRLARIAAGDPVGRWPRVVVGMDGISIDNRAWALSLDVAEVDRARWLWDQAAVAPREEGRAVAAPGAASTIRAVTGPLSELRAVLADAERQGHAPPEALLVVPDARVPWSAVQDVFMAAFLSGYGTVTVAGRVGDHLRTPLTRDPEGFGACGLRVVVVQDADGVVLHAGDGGRVGAADGRCDGLPPDALGGALRTLAEGCRAHAGVRCIDVVHAVSGDPPARDVLAALASTWAEGGPVRQGPLAGAIGDPAGDCTAHLGLKGLDVAAFAQLCAPPPPSTPTPEEVVQDLFDEGGGMTLDEALRRATP